jgi:hypothetical protein
MIEKVQKGFREGSEKVQTGFKVQKGSALVLNGS